MCDELAHDEGPTDPHALEKEVFAEYGVHFNDTTYEHFQVLMEALRLHSDRSLSYGNVWRKYGALANLLNAARKADRLMHSWWHGSGVPALHKSNLDDAFDMINYITFFIRDAKKGNITGG